MNFAKFLRTSFLTEHLRSTATNIAYIKFTSVTIINVIDDSFNFLLETAIMLETNSDLSPTFQ